MWPEVRRRTDRSRSPTREAVCRRREVRYWFRALGAVHPPERGNPNSQKVFVRLQTRADMNRRGFLCWLGVLAANFHGVFRPDSVFRVEDARQTHRQQLRTRVRPPSRRGSMTRVTCRNRSASHPNASSPRYATDPAPTPTNQYTFSFGTAVIDSLEQSADDRRTNRTEATSRQSWTVSARTRSTVPFRDGESRPHRS